MVQRTFIHPIIKRHSLMCHWYIVDIFILWEGTKNEFETLINELNACHSTIEFGYTISTKDVNFLDTTLFVNNTGKLVTQLYRKPTDYQSYLHVKSENPPLLKRSLPYSEVCPSSKNLSRRPKLHQKVRTTHESSSLRKPTHLKVT